MKNGWNALPLLKVLPWRPASTTSSPNRTSSACQGVHRNNEKRYTNITKAPETEVDAMKVIYPRLPSGCCVCRLKRGHSATCSWLWGLCGPAESSEVYENGRFAMASTDMDGSTDGGFALDEDTFIDFAYLSVHKTSEVSKALIKQYYGQEQRYAYFKGCSNWRTLTVSSDILQFQNSLHHLGTPCTTPTRSYRCGCRDGIEDGLLTDPRLCGFDPTTIQCTDDTNNSTCL